VRWCWTLRLALLNREPGHEEITQVIPDAAISAVNLSEEAANT
jgi:PIN domain nuclease of toxin-antitoxin system